MRLLIITVAIVATVVSTMFGLQALFPSQLTAEDDTTQAVTAEQIFERSLEPAPLPEGRLLMRANEIDIDVTPPEQGQLSEDMDAPMVADAEDDGANDNSLTDDALRLATLSETEAEPNAETATDAPQADAEPMTESAPAPAIEVAEASPEKATPPKATETPRKTTENKRATSDIDMSADANQPTIAPTAAAQPKSTPNNAPATDLALRDDKTANAKKVQDAETQRPSRTPPPSLPSGTLSSARPLADDSIATVPHEIDAPRRAMPTPAPRTSRPAPVGQPATATAPAPQNVEPEAWWVRSTTSEQLSVIHVGTAAFNRAIVLMTDGGFTSVRSATNNIEVLLNGIVVTGTWTISPANDHLLIFPLTHAGNYEVTIGTGLQDRNGRLWPHTVRGTIRVH